MDDLGQRRWLVEKLREALARVAGQPEEQVEYLRRLGSPESADELALELDDIAEAALSREGPLTPEQRSRIRELDQKLDGMSGVEKADLWTETALRSTKEWEEVRQCAKVALDELGRERDDQD